MRLPNTAHTSRPWRIHELTGDFRLEDVWALPTPGGPDDFPRLVQGFPRLVRGISAALSARDQQFVLLMPTFILACGLPLAAPELTARRGRGSRGAGHGQRRRSLHICAGICNARWPVSRSRLTQDSSPRKWREANVPRELWRNTIRSRD